MNCPFCRKVESKQGIFFENNNFIAFFDEYPVSKGHALIVPKRHVGGYFCGMYKSGLNDEEKKDLIDAIDNVQWYLSRQFLTDDFNVGFNDGEYAGQTVGHFHCHVIPRYKGDTKDPRGGIRGCVPEKMKY